MAEGKAEDAEQGVCEMTARPLAIDLYCGLGGWSEGLASARIAKNSAGARRMGRPRLVPTGASSMTPQSKLAAEMAEAARPMTDQEALQVATEALVLIAAGGLSAKAHEQRASDALARIKLHDAAQSAPETRENRLSIGDRVRDGTSCLGTIRAIIGYRAWVDWDRMDEGMGTVNPRNHGSVKRIGSLTKEAAK